MEQGRKGPFLVFSFITWGLGLAVLCVCVCLVQWWCYLVCAPQIITIFKVYIFSQVLLQYVGVKQHFLFVRSTDASKPRRICTVCKIPVRSTKTINWVWLRSWWGTSLLHGKWQGRRRYVYEHGTRTLLTGTIKLLLILIAEIKCICTYWYSVIKYFPFKILTVFFTLLKFTVFMKLTLFNTVFAKLVPQIFASNKNVFSVTEK